MEDSVEKSDRNSRKSAELGRILLREELKAQIKRIGAILKKPEIERTGEEKTILVQASDVVEVIQKRAKCRDLQKQRQLEIEDPPAVLQKKCKQLAAVIKKAEHLVIYTGAGISTAASIPDYRGPNGVWTLLQQGREIKSQDLSDADPTYTHMFITALYEEGLVKRVVSQNCDGLHLRSGLPRSALSEVHGNMYIEMCKNCDPHLEYLRLFDVTEKTGVRRHVTGRHCDQCDSLLRDTIVHFGEKGGIEESPYNWAEAVEAAEAADVIVCLGSSLKVLKKYPCLWSMHVAAAKRPSLYIVNLQWTPKDDVATLKINGKCDEVMKRVSNYLKLQLKPYKRDLDPIFALATSLKPDELNTTCKKIMTIPTGYDRQRFLQTNKLKSTTTTKRKAKQKKPTEKKTRGKTANTNTTQKKSVARNTHKDTKAKRPNSKTEGIVGICKNNVDTVQNDISTHNQKSIVFPYNNVTENKLSEKASGDPQQCDSGYDSMNSDSGTSALAQNSNQVAAPDGTEYQGLTSVMTDHCYIAQDVISDTTVDHTYCLTGTVCPPSAISNTHSQLETMQTTVLKPTPALNGIGHIQNQAAQVGEFPTHSNHRGTSLPQPMTLSANILQLCPNSRVIPTSLPMTTIFPTITAALVGKNVGVKARLASSSPCDQILQLRQPGLSAPSGIISSNPMCFPDISSCRTLPQRRIAGSLERDLNQTAVVNDAKSVTQDNLVQQESGGGDAIKCNANFSTQSECDILKRPSESCVANAIPGHYACNNSELQCQRNPSMQGTGYSMRTRSSPRPIFSAVLLNSRSRSPAEEHDAGEMSKEDSSAGDVMETLPSETNDAEEEEEPPGEKPKRKSASVPGWFGKGFNPRRLKKKRLK